VRKAAPIFPTTMAKKVKIKFIKHPAGFPLAYFPGEIGLFDPLQAEDLIEAGVGIIIQDEDAQSNQLPDDMPGRNELHAAGVTTLSECADISDFSQFKGIGKALSQKINSYLNNSKS
jgi:hypothetical protein